MPKQNAQIFLSLPRPGTTIRKLAKEKKEEMRRNNLPEAERRNEASSPSTCVSFPPFSEERCEVSPKIAFPMEIGGGLVAELWD